MTAAPFANNARSVVFQSHKAHVAYDHDVSSSVGHTVNYLVVVEWHLQNANHNLDESAYAHVTHSAYAKLLSHAANAPIQGVAERL